MAVEIPVVVDIEQAFKDAAARVPKAMKPLQDSIRQLEEDIAFWKDSMKGVSVSSKDFEFAAQEIRKTEEALDLLNSKVSDFVNRSGSVKQLSGSLAVIQQQFERMGAQQMFDASGALSDDAKKLQKDYANVATELDRVRSILTAEYEAQKRNTEEAEKQKNAAQEHQQALTMTANSMSDLNTKLAAWQQELNTADVGSAKWTNAAAAIVRVSEKMQKVREELKKIQTETGSIDRLNAELQRLNRQWNAMGSADKFIPGTDKLTAEAQQIVRAYRAATAELEKQGKSLSKIIQEQKQIEQGIQNAISKRKYEDLVLKSTANTMGRLSEQARILSERLNNARFGTKRYDELKTKLEEVRRKMQEVQGSTSGVNSEMKKQSLVLQNLTSIASMYFSVFGALRFVKNVRETTAEFEMQRVALAGIIKDADKAESLFMQIKAAAIESPFQIKELVTFTKQLSAYRIETDQLFDVTKRLADVSAGLGVDMNRLVLAYGQVKAASVLRGQELRQFTEAGIPLVDLLAKKFSELNGKMVSTADVFELISKRAIPFEMISEIFEDMTNKGGIFYKMQEKQAETLAGQWANLKDSLSIMYDEIGNTSVAHSAMSALISDAKVLFNNWRIVAQVLKTVAVQFGVIKVVSLFMPILTKNTQLAEKATIAKARADALEAANMQKSNIGRTVAIKQLQAYSKWMQAASVATTGFGRGIKKMVASFLGGGWITAVTMALSVAVGWLISMRQEAARLDKELQKIGNEGAVSINRSVSNFERLANAAVNAADGSNAQNEALDELKRTYSEIIPEQNLEIDALKKLEGNYRTLTDAIKEKISMQIREKQISAVTDEYTQKTTKQRKAAKDALSMYGLDKEQINAVLEEIQKAVSDGLLSTESTVRERVDVYQDIIKNLTGITVSLQSGYRDFEGHWHNVADFENKAFKSLDKIVSSTETLDKRVKGINDEWRGEVGTMGVYADAWDKLDEVLKNVTVSEKEFGDKFSFNYKKEKVRRQVEEMAIAIKDAFKDTGIDITDALIPNGHIDFKKLLDAASTTNRWGLTSYLQKIQKSYEGLVPSNPMVAVIERKFQEIASSVGLAMDDVQGYLLRGEKDMQDYQKEISSSLEEAKRSVINYQKMKEDYEKAPGVALPVNEEDVSKADALVKFLTLLLEYLDGYKKTTNRKGSYTQDPFIARMQERIKFMEDFKKGYDDLSKYMSGEGAINEQLRIMSSRGYSLGLDEAEQKRAATELSKWYEDARKKAFEEARKHGASGTIEEFLRQEIKDTSNKGRALKDSQKLIQSLWDAQTDLDTSEMKKKFDESLKKLEDEIKRSETARNFYKNILDLTGDEDLAATMSVSVYGNVGDEFKDRLQKQLDEAFKAVDKSKVSEDVYNTLSKAVSEQDFNTILDNLDAFPEKWRDILKKMSEDDEKHSAELLNNFAKLIQKYGDTAQKVSTIKKRTENEIQKVKDALELSLKDSSLSEEAKDALRKRADEIIKSLEGEKDLDIFKLSDNYIKFFSEINVMTAEQAATVRGELRNAYLNAFHDGALSADELRKNLRAVDEQFNKLTEHTTLLGSYLSGGFDGANKKLQEYADNVGVLAEKMKSGKELDQAEQSFASRMLKMFGGAEVKNAKSYEDLIKAFSSSGGLKEAGSAFGQMGKGMSAMAAKGPGALAIVDAIFQAVHSTITSIQQMIDELNRMRSEENKVGDWFKYVSDFDKYTYSGWEKLKSGDVIGATADAVSSWISIFNNIQEDKVKKINDDIKAQEKLVDELQYSYERLEKAIQNSFGSEYIYNFQKQLENLQAQVVAYRKQAELERGKGKSAEEDVAKDYEKQARDIEDKIEDMRSQLSEFFSGTNLTSAAEEFAGAWIDAYKEFGSTTDAMSEKFNEMIESMINRSLAARIMQEMLQPIFDQIDTLASDGLLSTEEIASIAELAQSRIPLINDAMTNLMTSLASAGLDVRTSTAGLHGISKDIAGASEESILGLAAAINTQNFYISYVPTISENVSQILAAMTGGVSPTSPVETTETGEVLPSVQRMVYDHLPNMDTNLSEVLRLFRSVITTKNSKNYIAVN